jgi:hypothetical protein
MAHKRFEVDFVGHACLKVTHGETTLLTDPWLAGPAYTAQWYLYPLPDRSVPLSDVQYIQYTHGHEDHLHEPSFQLLPKNATVLLTKQWFASNRNWLLDQGFQRVREMTPGRWISLGDDVRMVSLVNNINSLSVLRSSDEIIVNANDALHSYDDACIDFYCRRIQSLVKGRPIDFVFCGFGGASYFPNCLRHAQKDDQTIALAREAHLARGFARVVQNLKPRMAFAFAAGLVLLEPFNHWINGVRFATDPIALTLGLVPEMDGRMFRLQPGDRISDGEFIRGATAGPGDPVADYRSIYAEEIRAKTERPCLAPERGNEVLEAVETNFRERLNRGKNKLDFDRALRPGDFDWAVRLRDCPEAIIRLTFARGELTATGLRPDQLSEVRDMVVEANSDVLLAGVSSLWGGDSLQIGYGGIFYLRSNESVEQNHTRRFVKLATKLPLQSDYLRMSPIRGIEHLIHSPYLAHQAMRKLLPNTHGATGGSPSAGYDARRWIEAPPCAGCPACDIAPQEDLTRAELSSFADDRAGS